MDYEILGIYSSLKKTAFGDSFLHQNGDKVYEIREFPLNSQSYAIVKSSLILNGFSLPLKKNYRKILVFPSLIFICYNKTLEIYDSTGKLIKEIFSNNTIFIGSYGFLITERVKYIVNFKGNFVFVNEEVSNLLNFTNDGVVFAVEGELSGQISTFNEENTSKGFLSIKSLKASKIFDKDGDCILNYNPYSIFKECALIQDIVACTSFELESLKFFESENLVNSEKSDCTIVLCKKCLFIIFNGFIVRKDLESEYLKIIPEKFVVHNYANEESFLDMLLILNCFIPIYMTKSTGIESFLAKLLNFNRDLSIDFIKNLKMSSIKSNTIDFQLLMCKVYRLVDDSSKKLIDGWIDTNNSNADQLFLIIIYYPNLLEKFISLCKKEEKLFYLDELKDFFIKTDNIETYQKELLKQGLLIFEYEGLEILNEIEKKQIASQKSVINRNNLIRSKKF